MRSPSILGLLIASAAVSAAVSVAARPAATPPAGADERVERAFSALTPSEKVGQLLLVAFSRYPDEGPADSALSLIRDSHIGGFVLQKGNLVFANEEGIDLPAQIAGLTATLQRAALGEHGMGVPVFIAVDHEGDGDPTTHLREGFTALPSPMAIGATWVPQYAESVGAIVGRELAAVGVNLLLGPGLDVLAEPRVDSRGDIGTRAFGGDPYWVAQMGKAYIRGVHSGSDGRVATVAKHFPGHGGSDRLPDEEVPTVNKSLSELRRIELPPFTAVTEPPGKSADAAARTDGIMTSHIRYLGFQGQNFRRGTKPISIDPEALGAILELEGLPYGRWHNAGGLIVADSLGVRAIRRYYDPSLESFRHRDVARRALMAGNDLLILAQFAATPAWSEQRRNVEDTVRYLAGLYQADGEFRARVDASVRRVLERKALLYPSWSVDEVAARPQDASAATGLADARATVAAISRAAVAALRTGDPPMDGQHLVIITDDAGRLTCAGESCGLPAQRREALAGLGNTLLESMIMKRYGPAGTGLLRPADVLALQFCHLSTALAPTPAERAATGATPAPGEAPTVPAGEGCPSEPSPATVLAALRGADWIVFGFADLPPAVVRDLIGFYLPRVTQLVQASRTQLAVLSFGPPYYIDGTNYSHLDAYIAAHSKIPPSIEAAVQVLFGDLRATGWPPVSIRDAGYRLPLRLEPDPDRPFPLRFVAEPPPGPRSPPLTVAVAIGPVLDHNGNPVPDDTEVELRSEPPAALVGGPTLRVRTVSGRAATDVTLVGSGSIELHATSGQATAVHTLTVELARAADEPAVASAGSMSAPARSVGAPQRRLRLPDLLLALAAVVLVNGIAVTRRAWRRSRLEDQLRTVLLVTAGGLAAYVLSGVLLTRSAPLVRQGWLVPGASRLAVGATVVGALAGLLAGAYRERRVTGPPR